MKGNNRFPRRGEWYQDMGYTGRKVVVSSVYRNTSGTRCFVDVVSDAGRRSTIQAHMFYEADATRAAGYKYLPEYGGSQ